MDDTAETNIRTQTHEKILVILTTKLQRDNKNNYCKSHAENRAKIIEDSLFNNCYRMASENWANVYTTIDIDALVEKVEAKTSVCVYKN